MSSKDWLRKCVFCGILAAASMCGAPMPPEQIEELLSAMSRPGIVHALPEERETGDDLPKRLKEFVFFQ